MGIDKNLIAYGMILAVAVGGNGIRSLYENHFSKRHELERLADEDHSGSLSKKEKFKMYHMCGISEPGKPTPIGTYKLSKEDIEKGIVAYKKGL